ncbi:hypothetical protein THF1D04_10430 [Vibrio owensii]|uniref:Uncharacterized protein n=1 Tax=Vibrio owensii TaxID=696485 RepID=A0AAU9PY35_9VIBR|nr:hypothetical protein THF1D04_10430 [Vibrio owensii]
MLSVSSTINSLVSRFSFLVSRFSFLVHIPTLTKSVALMAGFVILPPLIKSWIRSICVTELLGIKAFNLFYF